MATTVPNNPFNTQQPKAANTGIVGGAMAAPATISADQINQFKAASVGRSYTDVAKDAQKQGLSSAQLGQVFGFSGAEVDSSGYGSAGGLRSDLAHKVYNATGNWTYPGEPNNPAGAGGSSSTASTSSASPLPPAATPATYTPTPPPPPAATPATYTPTQRTVDKPTETAQGQVESILSKDSPLMQRARALAKQGMAQRGLVNSSMSQGAGVAAMIDRATPIADRDAQIYSQAASENMNAMNTSGQFNATEINRFGLQKGQQDFASGENALDRANQQSMQGQQFAAQRDLAAMQQQFQATQAQLDRDNQFKITEFQNNLQNANVSKSFATDVARNTLSVVQAIQADPNLNSVADGYIDSSNRFVANADRATWPKDVKESSPKSRAVSDAMGNANNTLQWGATFYNMPLPTIATPGGTAGSVRPGAGAGAGAALNSNSLSGMSQSYINQLVQEAASQAGKTLSQADVTKSLSSIGASTEQINAAIAQTGVVTKS
jgi:hypothetical protein